MSLTQELTCPQPVARLLSGQVSLSTNWEFEWFPLHNPVWDLNELIKKSP